MLTSKPNRPKPVEGRAAEPVKPSAKYAAVVIVAGGPCCEAVKARAGQKILAAQAPTLPLPDCSMPMRCTCRFRKFADRREGDEDRRHQNSSMRSILYSGPERRKSPRRRPDD